MRDRWRLDGHKLMYHPVRVASWLEAGDNWDRLREVYPLYLEVSPTGACNHRCTFCALNWRGYRTQAFPPDLLAARLTEAARLGVRSVMFAGEGEPLLYPQLAEVIASASQAGLDCALTTNGSLLSGRFLQQALGQLSWIKVSLDAGRPQTYSLLHRTRPQEFFRVVENARRAVGLRNDQKLRCTVGIQVLLLPENRAELRDAARVARDEAGADYLVVKPYSQHPLSTATRYRDITYEDAEKLAGELAAFQTDTFHVIVRTEALKRRGMPKRFPRCLATPFFWAYVSNDGGLYACSAFLGDERFLLGDLRTTTFRRLWEGQRRQQNWRLLAHMPAPSVCRENCRMEACNEYLWSLLEPPPHVNFI